MPRWGRARDWDEVCRRASARRAWHALQRIRVLVRRRKVVRLADALGGLCRRGVQAAVARRLGVSRATVCRDIAAILRMVNDGLRRSPWWPGDASAAGRAGAVRPRRGRSGSPASAVRGRRTGVGP